MVVARDPLWARYKAPNMRKVSATLKGWPRMRWTNVAPSNGCLWGSGEPKQRALALPVKREVGGAEQAASAERRRLAAFDNRSDDVGCQVA